MAGHWKKKIIVMEVWLCWYISICWALSVWRKSLVRTIFYTTRVFWTMTLKPWFIKTILNKWTVTWNLMGKNGLKKSNQSIIFYDECVFDLVNVPKDDLWKDVGLGHVFIQLILTLRNCVSNRTLNTVDQEQSYKNGEHCAAWSD